MSTDLVSWLRAALDDEERDTDVHYVVCASLPDDPDHTAHGMGPQECDCGEPEQLVRTVAAHRAILALHCRVDQRPDWYGHGREWPPEGACYGCNANFDEEYAVEDVNDCPMLRALASIYEDRPGFDPSWKVET